MTKDDACQEKKSTFTHMICEWHAQEYGVNCAFILNKLIYHIRKNIGDKRCTIEGRTYECFTVKSWERILPFLTSDQIRYALKKLIDLKVITTSIKLNKHWSAQDLWYAFLDEDAFLGIEKVERRIAENSQLHLGKFPTDNWENSQLTTGKIPNCSLYSKNSLVKDSLVKDSLVDSVKPIDESDSRIALKEDSKKKPTPKKKDSIDLEKEFQDFYNTYPKKIGKSPAKKAYEKARRSQTHEKIMTALKLSEEAWNEEKRATQYKPYPATWLNSEPWNDFIMEKTIEVQPARNAEIEIRKWEFEERDRINVNYQLLKKFDLQYTDLGFSRTRLQNYISEWFKERRL